MLQNKLPLFEDGDTIKHIEFGFIKHVGLVFEEDDGNFSYAIGLSTTYFDQYYSEDELFDEYVII